MEKQARSLGTRTPLRKRPRSLTWRHYYAIIAVAVLVVTAAYWAFLSAKVNLHNADQIVDPFLFDHSAVFHGALFPGAHSALLKWPLFGLISLFGTTQTTLLVATVVLAVGTIVAFAYLLYRIEKRPLIFGTLCLALASVLMLIPTEPYPGALLPVNMAMLNTRNIEYIVYLIALLFIVRTPRLLHWKVVIAALCLALLFVSDKLFLAFSLGGSTIMLIAALLRRDTTARSTALAWLVSGVAAAFLAMASVWAINWSGITTIANSSQTGPYALVHTVKDAAIGAVYVIMHIFTNLGANPAFDATVIKSIPGTAWHRLLSISGIAYVINILVALAGLIAVVTLIGRKQQTIHGKIEKDNSRLFALSLIWTSLAAIFVFIATNHYYPADARYLAIITFTVFVALAAVSRHLTIKPAIIACASIALLIGGIGVGVISATFEANRSNASYAQTANENKTIAAALEQHEDTTLIGDYWRVMPIRLQDPTQNVIPLGDCFTPRDTLISKAWQTNIKEKSFTYLLSLKPTVTGFPSCSVNQVIATYGRPNSTQLISGTLANPNEMLLFYDSGTTHAKSIPQTHSTTGSFLPVSITSLHPTCSTGQTFLNVVAHQDDDILFINPDTYHHLKSGDCVRSVYLTAGDAGASQLYWLGREDGSRAAYASMLNITNPVWISRPILLSNNSYATISFLKDNPQVTLLFMHLPDGSPTGIGFPATHHESLARLKSGAISTIHSVDGQSSYTSQSLIQTLSTIMTTFKPDEIDTQATHNESSKHPDHSDHLTTGWYTNQAYTTYSVEHSSVPINFYIGYPEQDQPGNVSPEDLKAVEAAFFAYAKHDKGTCESIITCSKMSYGKYLDRQYKEAPAKAQQ